jgi:hypothetical protein
MPKSQKQVNFNETKMTVKRDYKKSEKKCSKLKDNPKDICLTQAKSMRTHTEQSALLKFKNTLSNRTSAIKKNAEANFDVDEAKCKAQVGNAQEVCIKEAMSTKVNVIASATADKKIIEARKDEVEDKNTAEYKVAIEKCDAMTSAAKDTYITSAKKSFEK